MFNVNKGESVVSVTRLSIDENTEGEVETIFNEVEENTNNEVEENTNEEEN